LDLTFTVANFSANWTSAGELIAAQLKDAGVRATIKVVDGATYTAQVQGRGDFEMYLGSAANAPSADVALFSKYHSTGSRNVTKVNDPKLDTMVEKQTTLVRDPDGRKKLLLDIQRYILDQGYIR